MVFFSSLCIHRFLFCIVFIPYVFLFSAHIFDWGAQKANPAWTFNKVNSVSSAKVKHIPSVKLSTFCLSCGYFVEISLFSFPACWLCWPFLMWEWERTMQYILWINVSFTSFFQTTKTKSFSSLATAMVNTFQCSVDEVDTSVILIVRVMRVDAAVVMIVYSQLCTCSNIYVSMPC